MIQPNITSSRPGFYAVHAHYDEDDDETIFHAHVVEAWGTVDITQKEKEEEFAVLPMVFLAGRYGQLSTIDFDDENLIGIFFSQTVFENTRGATVVQENELIKDHDFWETILSAWKERDEGGEECHHDHDHTENPLLNTAMINKEKNPTLFLRMDEEED